MYITRSKSLTSSALVSPGTLSVVWREVIWLSRTPLVPLAHQYRCVRRDTGDRHAVKVIDIKKWAQECGDPSLSADDLADEARVIRSLRHDSAVAQAKPHELWGVEALSPC